MLAYILYEEKNFKWTPERNEATTQNVKWNNSKVQSIELNDFHLIQEISCCPFETHSTLCAVMENLLPLLHIFAHCIHFTTELRQ